MNENVTLSSLIEMKRNKWKSKKRSLLISAGLDSSSVHVLIARIYFNSVSSIKIHIRTRRLITENEKGQRKNKT